MHKILFLKNVINTIIIAYRITFAIFNDDRNSLNGKPKLRVEEARQLYGFFRFLRLQVCGHPLTAISR